MKKKGGGPQRWNQLRAQISCVVKAEKEKQESSVQEKCEQWLDKKNIAKEKFPSLIQSMLADENFKQLAYTIEERTSTIVIGARMRKTPVSQTVTWCLADNTPKLTNTRCECCARSAHWYVNIYVFLFFNYSSSLAHNNF